MKVLVQAPSNIAWIKYMGKTDPTRNLPENPSLSMTLDRLCTYVELEKTASAAAASFSAEPLNLPIKPTHGSALGDALAVIPARLDEKGQERILRHLARTAAQRSTAGMIMRSANTFPASSGIASSASAFAAATLAAAVLLADDPRAFAADYDSSPALRRALAAVSREGSGSSCRSFEGPFVLWQGEEARTVPSRLPALRHFVILISSETKVVSSSQAHLRVKTSPLWQGRAERAGRRCEELVSALQQGDLPRVSQLAWTEAWEMHSLFHTSQEPFTYWKPQTLEALEELARALKDDSPPIVTLDAGPNVHLSVEERRGDHWREKLGARYGASRVLEDRPGQGARVLELSS